jgi:hypothetical protein
MKTLTEQQWWSKANHHLTWMASFSADDSRCYLAARIVRWHSVQSRLEPYTAAST